MKVRTVNLHTKKLLYLLPLVITLSILLLGIYSTAIGVEHVAQIDSYTPISALPIDDANVQDPTGYIAGYFKIFIIVISFLAVIRLMICGFQFMLSESISIKADAKKCIWAVIFGLFIILLSWLILFTINPDLVKINFESISKQAEDIPKVGDTSGAVSPSDDYIYKTGDFCLYSSIPYSPATFVSCFSGSDLTTNLQNCFKVLNTLSGATKSCQPAYYN